MYIFFLIVTNILSFLFGGFLSFYFYSNVSYLISAKFVSNCLNLELNLCDEEKTEKSEKSENPKNPKSNSLPNQDNSIKKDSEKSFNNLVDTPDSHTYSLSQSSQSRVTPIFSNNKPKYRGGYMLVDQLGSCTFTKTDIPCVHRNNTDYIPDYLPNMVPPIDTKNMYGE